MKTLIVNGSPRTNGDTAGLLKIFTDHLQGEYRILDCYRCNISPCIDCRYCHTHQGCSIQDDMQQIYSCIEQCDNVVIASPIYFTEVTGRTLDVASRLQTYFAASFFRHEKPFEKKKHGGIILVGGGSGGMEHAASTAEEILRLLKCEEIHEPVASLHTDQTPAVDDQKAVEEVIALAKSFRG